MKVYISGQRRGVTEAIKRDLRRRSAVEPVRGHAKSEHRMGRNFLKGTHGDAANAVLAAAGYNFRRLLAWLAILWRVLIMQLLADVSDDDLAPIGDASASGRRRSVANGAYFTADYFQASNAFSSIAWPSADFWKTSLAMRLSLSRSGKSNQACVCIRSRLRAAS